MQLTSFNPSDSLIHRAERFCISSACEIYPFPLARFLPANQPYCRGRRPFRSTADRTSCRSRMTRVKNRPCRTSSKYCGGVPMLRNGFQAWLLCTSMVATRRIPHAALERYPDHFALLFLSSWTIQVSCWWTVHLIPRVALMPCFGMQCCWLRIGYVAIP